MARIAADITWLIGSTPLVELKRLSPVGGRVVAKLEAFNPSGSNKDRTALGMVEQAEQTGALKAGGTIIECTTGDLGLAIAMVGRRRGYRVVLTMPENVPAHRPALLHALGAEIVRTDAAAGMRGAMAHAEALVAKTPGAVCLQAFSNRGNARIHGDTTAHEIWQDTDGAVRAVVVPIGTGGTAAGCAAVLRSRGVRVIGVEPSTSAVLSGKPAGTHDIPGIGAGFVPSLLSRDTLDESLSVTDAEARAAVRRLAREESILVGPAGGAVLHAAIAVAQRPEHQGQLVVAVLPDSGERFCDHRAYRLED